MSIVLDMVRAATGDRDANNDRWWSGGWAGGRKTKAGETVSPESANALSPYFAALCAISEDVAKLPLFVYRHLKPAGKEKVLDHPAFHLLHREANPEMGPMTFRETLTGWALGWGNGIAEIERAGNGDPVALWPIHPNRVAMKRLPADRDPLQSLVYEVRNEGAEPTYLSTANVLHLIGRGGGIWGKSIAQVAAESIGVGLAAQSFGAAFFGNGTHICGVLEHPGELDDDAHERLRKDWVDRYGGPGNVGKPAILEEGMKWARVGIPPEEAQFLETRQFQVEEIARWFRIPPHKIQHLARATFSNIEHQSIEYVVDCLMTWLDRWEGEIARKLFRTSEQDLFAEHVVQGLMRGDSRTRGQFYREQFGIGTLSINEIRELENRNPIEGGDVYYVPLNMTPADQAAAEDVDAPAKSSSEDEDAEGPPDRESLRAAMFGVFQDAAARVVRKEIKAVVRAMKKYDVQADFDGWLKRFFEGHLAYMAESLAVPALAAWRLAAPDADTGQIDPIVFAICRAYVQRTTSLYLSDFDSEADSATFEDRESDLAMELAETTFDEVATAALCVENQL